MAKLSFKKFFENLCRVSSSPWQKCGYTFLPRRTGAFLAVLYAAEITLLVGFAAHTDSGKNLVLGKYTLPYFGFLVVLVLPAPFMPAFVRFLFRPSRRTLPNGQVIVLGVKKKMTFLGIAILLALIALEAYFQAGLAFQPEGRPPDYLLGFHPFLQIVPSPLTYDGVNSHGFRGREIRKEKKPGTFRVFCLGGSTTFEPFLKLEDTFCWHLEALLRDHFPQRDIEVQNAGMSWYTSQHSLINFLIRVQDFNPDLVVMCHGINDLCRSFLPPRVAIAGYGYRADYSHHLGPQAELFLDLSHQRAPTLADASVILRGMTQFWSTRFMSDWRYRRRPMEAWEVNDFPSLASFRRNVEALCDMARCRQVTLVLATQPSLYRPDLTTQEQAALIFPKNQCNDGLRQASVLTMVRGMKLFNDTTRAIAKEQNLALVDLDAVIPKSLEYFEDDVHYLPKGSRQIAEALAQFIIQASYISP